MSNHEMETSKPLKSEEITPSLTEEEKPVKRIVSRHPGHTWLVDLTAMPISSGFWTSWIPNALPQYWPFCFWIAIILDHFSRKVVGFAVFRKNPKSGEITDML
ncbi:MAG: hypothetical protein NT118_12165, partial [Lentisphaerae bacterium]|nr:hypothetical protein [Lentisphaerota bacterium]